MSLDLNQPSKFCVGMRSSLILSNGFSSSSLQIPPCSIFGCGKLVIRRNITQGVGTYLAKKVPVEMVDEDVRACEASIGWLATFKNDGMVSMIDLLWETGEARHFWLPPFVTLPHCQTQIITNVAMSSSSLEEEDCVVAVKFLGPQLSFFKPSNSECINIKIQNPCFFSSLVIFSKKDNMFRIPGSGGHLIGSWDLRKHKHNPKLQKLRFKNLPELTKRERELLDSCCTREVLLETESTNDVFLVKWYRKTTGKIIKGLGKMKTKAVMVFKLDEKRNAVYTQDIGDLYIFISEDDPFCAPAIICPYRRPNHVEIFDEHEGVIINAVLINLASSPFVNKKYTIWN